MFPFRLTVLSCSALLRLSQSSTINPHILHPAQTSPQPSTLVPVREITDVRRTDLRPYAIEVATKGKSIYIAVKNDIELYEIMDDICESPFLESRSQLLRIRF
jgi:hypothetical protein